MKKKCRGGTQESKGIQSGQSGEESGRKYLMKDLADITRAMVSQSEAVSVMVASLQTQDFTRCDPSRVMMNCSANINVLSTVQPCSTISSVTDLLLQPLVLVVISLLAVLFFPQKGNLNELTMQWSTLRGWLVYEIDRFSNFYILILQENLQENRVPSSFDIL